MIPSHRPFYFAHSAMQIGLINILGSCHSPVQTTGICKGALNVTEDGRRKVEREQGQDTLAGLGYCCCWWLGTKGDERYWKSFVLSIIMSGRGGVFHHTHGSPATSELSTTGGQLL